MGVYLYVLCGCVDQSFIPLTEPWYMLLNWPYRIYDLLMSICNLILQIGSCTNHIPDEDVVKKYVTVDLSVPFRTTYLEPFSILELLTMVYYISF